MSVPQTRPPTQAPPTADAAQALHALLRDLHHAREDLRLELRGLRDARQALEGEVEAAASLAQALRRANDERLQDEAEGWPWPSA
jgi:phosphatidylserine/phosphatidylglycerophosphate/cardiolipin synthase-like enzyme